MEEFKFGRKSNAKLATGCEEIRLLANRALHLSPYDFTIIWVWRGEEVQDGLFQTGASTKEWPDSKHNVMKTEDRAGHQVARNQPDSEALDFGPWVDRKIPWDDTHIFAVIAGSFFAAGIEQGIKVRWGGDWNSNGKSKGDQKLMDYGHIEVII